MPLNLETTESGQSPLQHFRGVLKDYEVVDNTDEQTGRQWRSVAFNFTDVEVLAATEPYIFPIATIKVGMSSSKTTRWGAWTSSVKTLFPEADENTIDTSLVGQQQEWKLQPYKLRVRGEDGTWGDAEQDCWQVVAVDGVSPPEDLTDFILNTAEGKDEKALHQALLTDQRVTSRPDIVTSITDRLLVPALLEGGKLTRDADGILHKV